MRELALRALDTARSQGASYADARVVARKSESITVRNQNVEGLTADESLGFGVRVIVDGYWGFASSQRMTAEETDRVAAQAVRIARASARPGGPRGAPWAPCEPRTMADARAMRTAWAATRPASSRVMT